MGSSHLFAWWWYGSPFSIFHIGNARGFFWTSERRLSYQASSVLSIVAISSGPSRSWSSHNRKSGTSFKAPFLYWTSKSYSSRLSDQRASRPVGSFSNLSHQRLLWSVTTVKRNLSRYSPNFLMDYTTAKHSFSVTE